MNEQMMQQAIMQQAADAGRSTDTILAHLTLGEVVLPREMVEDPEVSQVLQAIFEAYGVDMREFTVGDQANKINPETGYPEFFFKKVKSFFKKIAPIALPILGSMVPGVGTALGAALGGAAGGLVSGGGIKGALTGAALGGIGGSLASGAGALGGGTSGLSSGAMGLAKSGTLLPGGAFGGGIGSLSSYVKPAASLYSSMQEDEANEEARKAMLDAQGRAESALNPYSQLGLSAQNQLAGNLSSGFNPGDLASDPGYQFRLQQGQDALNKSLAAQGLGQSGQALKAAQEYGQGFAQQEYDNAYNRWLQQNQQLAGVGSQGLGTAQALGGIYADTGNIQAASTLGDAERQNKRIAEILAGLGY